MRVFGRSVGGWSVSAFLTLSGFLGYYAHYGKTIDYSLKGCIGYARKSVKRMYPLHLIMLIPALLINFALVLTGREVFSLWRHLSSLIPNIFLVHTWFPANYIYFGFNGVAWYLSTFAFLCFMFPILHNWMKNWNRRKAFTVMSCCWLIPLTLSMCMTVLKLDSYKEWFLYVFPPVRLMDYFAGMQVGWLFCNRKKNSISDSTVTFLQTFLMVVSVAAIYVMNRQFTSPIIMKVVSQTSILCMPISLAGIYTIAEEKGVINRLLASRLFVKIGGVSMYAFLIHYMILQYVHMLMANFISEDVNTWILTLITAIFTTFFTWIYLKIKGRFTSHGLKIIT